MAKVTKNEFKATVNWLKNYIDRKISSSGSGGSTTTPVTKEYTDNKIMCNNNEIIYTIPAADITNADIKDGTAYTLQSTGIMSINETDKYIIIYGGVTYTNIEYRDRDESGFTFSGEGLLYGYDDDGNPKFGIINKFGLNTTNDNACRVTIHGVDTSNITDLIIMKKTEPVSGNIKALSKVDLDALTKQEDNTIYIITE